MKFRIEFTEKEIGLLTYILGLYTEDRIYDLPTQLVDVFLRNNNAELAKLITPSDKMARLDSEDYPFLNKLSAELNTLLRMAPYPVQWPNVSKLIAIDIEAPGLDRGYIFRAELGQASYTMFLETDKGNKLGTSLRMNGDLYFKSKETFPGFADFFKLYLDSSCDDEVVFISDSLHGLFIYTYDSIVEHGFKHSDNLFITEELGGEICEIIPSKDKLLRSIYHAKDIHKSRYKCSDYLPISFELKKNWMEIKFNEGVQVVKIGLDPAHLDSTVTIVYLRMLLLALDIHYTENSLGGLYLQLLKYRAASKVFA